jgi:2-amino-4-hydroxy-6-hydroxymethyldihydropteridine diphosphokinase
VIVIRRVAAIALGSNLSSYHIASSGLSSEAGVLDHSPADNLREAVQRVGRLGDVLAVSSFYETDPVGFTEQPRFVNAAMLLETELEPLELMRELLAIERTMGRDRAAAPAKGPRVIDLDLLLMGDVVLSGARSVDGPTELTLPHPAMAERRFVLEPLAEIAPEMADPVSGRTVAEMLARLVGQDGR